MISKSNWKIVTGVIFCVTLSACSYLNPRPIAQADTLDGPVEGLSDVELARHGTGDMHFNDEIFTTEKGLGPLFVSNSCGSCHAGDGKGHPATSLTRFGQSDTLGVGIGWPGAPQLQNRFIAGHQAEVLPLGAPSTRLLAPLVSGVGFLEMVSDSLIYSRADVNDTDGDGISGKPNWVVIPTYVQPRPISIRWNGRYMGRFGKKGAAYDLTQQTSVAYNQDMGITSTNEDHDTYTGQSVDPEISQSTIADVVHYMATLKAPPRRNMADVSVLAGQALFAEIGCAKCHIPALKTGQSNTAALSHKVFYPYTDLLLHDMGQALNDGYTEGRAEPAEWKTPALWGLGLAEKSQGGKFFLLHDGRAGSVDKAILLHGGEAESTRNDYLKLSSAERNQLLAFLQSL